MSWGVDGGATYRVRRQPLQTKTATKTATDGDVSR